MTVSRALLDVLAASAQEDSGAALSIGRIVAKSNVLTVAAAGVELPARPAASCLLAPEIGDAVLIVAGSAGQTYVLAVLERPGTAPAVVSASVPSPLMRIEAGQLALSGVEELTLAAPRTTLRTGAFAVMADVVTFAARLMTQALEHFRSSARSVEIVSTDLAIKAARRTTLVEETDVLEAGTLVQTIATAAVMSAQSAVVTAQQDLRLDGERVTVG